MKLSQLLEALKPSQYRNLVKGWDKSKYADLFGGKYRIYIPLGEKAKDVKPNPEVESFVKSQGYEIEDYLTGIASKDSGKRKVRIGKLLAKEPELKKLFDNDPSRNSSQSEYIVVISRHPYDIAGMTSGRAWENESCMNLDTGVNKRYVPLDIKEGTLVAYLIKNTDKNIESPSARVLIKPFINLDGSGEIAFGVENKVYGKPSPEFQQTVVDWVDEINKRKLNGIFALNNKLYNDSFIDKVRVIGEIPEAVQLAVVKKNSRVIEYIKNPTEAVQLAALEGGYQSWIIPLMLKTNFIPSDEVQITAMKLFPNSNIFGDILGVYDKKYEDKIPSEKVQSVAVSINYRFLDYIENPSDEVIDIAIKEWGLKEVYPLLYHPSKELTKQYKELVGEDELEDSNSM